MNQPQVRPFQCVYTPQVPELLNKLGCTIAISTYQAGKVVFISAKDDAGLIQLPRSFDKAMGIAEDVASDKIAIASRDEVTVFSNSTELAKYYPKSSDKYDSLYMPRCTYYTGAIDIHDLNFGEGDALYAVNTMFSSIVKIDSNYSFNPFWTPPFIDKIAPEDRCHLNGMAMLDGKPKYATAFNNGNTRQSWRDTITTSGILMDIESNEIVAEGLPMPHSPRIHNGEIYLLLSATGELVKIDASTGEHETIFQIDGFVRGLSFHNDLAFIGLSKLRRNSSTFGKLPFAEKANEAGVLILHVPTKTLVGKIIYQTSLDEIYDVHVLANKSRPNIMNTLNEEHKQGLTTPMSTYWQRENPQQN